MQIGELSRRSGLSVDTLRYYEKIGLIEPPARDGGGRRDYDPDILRWIDFLGRLKATGMGIGERVRYAELRREGAGSLTERREILEAHRQAIAERIEALQQSLDLMDDKIDLYGRMERGEPVDPAFADCAGQERALT